MTLRTHQITLTILTSAAPPRKCLLQFLKLQNPVINLTIANSSYESYNSKFILQLLQRQIPLIILATANSSYNSYNSKFLLQLLQFK